MKKTLLIILAGILAFSPANAERQKKIEDLRPLKFPSSMQTLNISARSKFSYVDAMNRLARMQPDGYVIESLRYVRLDGMFVVLAKLRKV